MLERRLSGNRHPSDHVTFKRFPWVFGVGRLPEVILTAIMLRSAS
jgi:hypothetical protein